MFSFIHEIMKYVGPKYGEVSTHEIKTDLCAVFISVLMMLIKRL